MNFITPPKNQTELSRRYSNASTNSQRSNQSNIFPDARCGTHTSKISETRYQHTPSIADMQISENNSFDSHHSLGFSLKSIFPDSVNYDIRSSKKHQRGLSQPPTVLNPALLLLDKYSKNGLGLNKSFSSIHKMFYGKENYKKQKQVSVLTNEASFKEIKNTSHCRHASDADSVLYMEPDSKEIETENLPITVSTYNPFTTEENKEKTMRILGTKPCTAYCENCQMDVHTNIEFDSKKDIPRPFLTFFSSIFACCATEPSWLGKRVHRCYKCSEVVGFCN
ncbi:unnamed protein product [Blepharisma stoltei]|uniref:LITAF domain-containing protein n=1 Tax=Blepharisma stoltei TaxID=1481888 RepID=A0AAU9IMN4_9CILI|nr:unnamed protein product [Blepharisma stoltei]